MAVAGEAPMAATHSAVQFFDPSLVLTDLAKGYDEIFIAQTADAATIDFRFKGPRTETGGTVIDTRNIFLALQVTMDGPPGTDETPVQEPGYINNILNSLFANVEVHAEGVQLSSSNNLHAHKAQIETELSHPPKCKEGLLTCQGYTFEDQPSTFGSEPFIARKNSIKARKKLYLYGQLSVDFFGTEKFLLPDVEILLRLTRASREFVILDDGATEGFSLKIEKASLHVRFLELKPERFFAIERALQSGLPARYSFREIIPKSYGIPTGTIEHTFDDVFNRQPISRVVVAMNTETNFIGNSKTNPFHYQKFGLAKITIEREGQLVGGTPLFVNHTNVRAYYNTLKALEVEHVGNGITIDAFDDHFILVFKLTADTRTNDDTIRPELTGARLKIGLTFNDALKQNIRVLFYGERQSTVYISHRRRVLKNSQFIHG